MATTVKETLTLKAVKEEIKKIDATELANYIPV